MKTRIILIESGTAAPYTYTICIQTLDGNNCIHNSATKLDENQAKRILGNQNIKDTFQPVESQSQYTIC